MRRLTVLLMLTSLVLAVLPFVNSATYVVDDQYHWTCLAKGEKLAFYVCNSDCCITCQKNGYTTPTYHCDGSPCGCGSGNGNPGDLEPPLLNVLSPSNGLVFDTRSVPFDVEINENSDLYYNDSADPRRGFRKVCSNCKKFDSKVSFSDGPHVVDVLARDASGNEAKETRNFLIDSKKPRIRSTLPRSKAYSNGTFTVQYDEDNIKDVKLVYTQGAGYSSSGYTTLAKDSCPAGYNKGCTFLVQGLGQGPLSYYFIVEDVITQVQSKEVKVTVDTIPPVMTITQPVPGTYKGRALLDIDVTEDVTLEFMDSLQSRPRWSTLCSRCDNYNRTKYFSKGPHMLTLRATDAAGNSAEDLVSFTIV